MENLNRVKAIVKRHAGRDFGLVTRVAKRLGRSKALVSMVKNGRVTSHAVQEALESERRVMRAERAAGKEVV
jgi:hypothetical protein